MNGGEVTPALNSPARMKMLEARKLFPVFLAFFAVAATFTVFDLFLVRLAREHRAETGTRLFQRGTEARQAGRTADSLELFRAAHNQNPANPEYHVAFAQALRASGSTREAQTSLERLLARQPAHGAANAETARILADAGDWQNAAWYYRRALYGEWPDGTDLRPLRFELADLLAKHGAREQLLAEVVLLDSAPSDPAESRRIARLQLAAGDWPSAERHYRSLLRRSADDPALLAGLARAQAGAGKYVAAARTFRRALASGTADEAIKREAALVQSINEMDPTLRRLSAAEKHRRAHALVAATLSLLTACSPQVPAVVQAQVALESHQRLRRPLEAAESDLDLFENLWAARRELCAPTAKVPETLRLLALQLER